MASVPDELFFKLWECMNSNPDYESVEDLVRIYPPKHTCNNGQFLGYLTELYFSYQIARAVEDGLPLTAVCPAKNRIRGGYIFEQMAHGSISVKRKFKGHMEDLTDIDMLCTYDCACVPIIFEYTNGSRSLRRRLKRSLVRILFGNTASYCNPALSEVEFCEIRAVRSEPRITKHPQNWALLVQAKTELEEVSSRLYVGRKFRGNG